MSVLTIFHQKQYIIIFSYNLTDKVEQKKEILFATSVPEGLCLFSG